ncbi:acyl-CoA dehydrogenase family protein [Spirosoma utsteinense]|uniref:Glutaryl-CoA dehydrogenase n=1 Tax=Spirosoma utsteinense TaxID=2585773 RepID=A0ABR6VZ96_9BACT|nr:acyl-CoA dehydrogenase family protein [Spirosoma utsteinense]MBC3784603.1 glutaryl-CoA dehydrogenase [Spirosoma utsteinense]MBC3789644.1 glutaryl-CoA dehydrogenase [Spirosoma utsteinense]
MQAVTTTPPRVKVDTFESPDFYCLDDLLTAEHKLVRSAVRDFVKREITPIVEEYAQRAAFPAHLVAKFGQIGAFGSTIPVDYGGGGLDQISYGLMTQEIERGDSGMRSCVSVQNSLVMYPIYTFGSEEQKQRFLPRLAKGELLGCFGLTEASHGSDPGSMETNFIERSDYFLLNGSKLWITNGPIADIAIVWAKNDQGKIRGLIVERGMEGFTTNVIENKWSLRVSTTGELVFQDVRVPKENLLPEAFGLKSALKCLDQARYGIAWGALGAAMECYDVARRYALERVQFSKPIASFQLVQKKLAEMLTDITQAQLLCWRLGMIKNEDKATTAQISLAKRNNIEMALRIAREARQILGAMGITGDYPVMRHLMNLESVSTYEGTHDIHLLILGAEITGIPAYK